MAGLCMSGSVANSRYTLWGLERVVLHGHWEFVVTTFPFRNFQLLKQSYALEYEDGTPME